MTVSDVTTWIERPEYTGENRCLPCTAVNVAIALGLAGAVAAISPPAGAVAFAAFVAVIYLRGYLVPGTPTLSRRYLPERALERFGKAEPAERRPTIEAGDLVAAAEHLEAADVVRQKAHEEGLELTPDFRARWRERLSSDAFGARADSGSSAPASAGDGRADTVPVGLADVRTLLEADDVERRGEAAFELGGRRSIRWESEAALAADVAADRDLRERLAGWAALEFDERCDVLTGLRLLAERCPACDGRVETRRKRLEHCCRRARVGLESACARCGRSLAAVAVSETSPLLEWVSEPERKAREE